MVSKHDEREIVAQREQSSRARQQQQTAGRSFGADGDVGRRRPRLCVSVSAAVVVEGVEGLASSLLLHVSLG